MNILTRQVVENSVSELFHIIGQPVRIQILLIMGTHETCVGHLKAVLGIRQASISQHLMILRKANLVTAHRHGRNIFYRLTSPEIVDLIHQAAIYSGLDPESFEQPNFLPIIDCPCPQCNLGNHQQT